MKKTQDRTSTAKHAVLRKRREVELLKRGELRVEKFIDAAIQVFLEKGYRDARLSDIVALAGGSLSTLYRVFGNKEGLAHAIMALAIKTFGKGLEILDDQALSPEQALLEASDRIIENVLSPQHIVANRIVIADGLIFPELRDWFFQHGVAPSHMALADYFGREKAAGRLAFDSPRLAADQFYGMVCMGTMLGSVAGTITPADIPRMKAEAREAVAIFLRGAMPR